MENCVQGKTTHLDVIGLLPASGIATRIAPLPCSKEVYPLGISITGEKGKLVQKVACQYLLEGMQLADITKAYIVLRKGKWDIPSYLGDGAMLNMHLAYLIMHLPFGAPYTIDQAYPFVKNAIVAFGFPDIIFQPANVFLQLLACQRSTKADVVLGLFTADQPQKMDMVDIGEDRRVCQIIIKPQKTQLKYTWIIAVWTPTFTCFMHEYLSNIQKIDKHNKSKNIKLSENRELFVGDVIQAGINDGLHIEAVIFSDDYYYIDIGTPRDLLKAVRIINEGLEES